MCIRDRMPEQLITRFDRGAFRPPQPAVPQSGFAQPSNTPGGGLGSNLSGRSQRTTGISSQQPNDTSTPQGGLGSPQFSSPTQFGRTGFNPIGQRGPRTTGIRSSSSTPPGSNWGTANLNGDPAMYGVSTPGSSISPGNPAFPSAITPSPISPNATFNQGMPTGFLPPSALGSFGPRIIQQPAGAGLQRSPETNAGRTNGGGISLPRSNGGTGNPGFSTAIPGSEIIYGSLPGSRRTPTSQLTPSTRTRPTSPSRSSSPLLPR